jgi:hypothetical protein
MGALAVKKNGEDYPPIVLGDSNDYDGEEAAFVDPA